MKIAVQDANVLFPEGGMSGAAEKMAGRMMETCLASRL